MGLLAALVDERLVLGREGRPDEREAEEQPEREQHRDGSEGEDGGELIAHGKDLCSGRWEGSKEGAESTVLFHGVKRRIQSLKR